MTNSISLFIPKLSLEHSCFCGQAFRWKKCDENEYVCVIGNDVYSAKYSDSSLHITSLCNSCPDVAFFAHYFDAATSYDAVEAIMVQSDILRKAIPYGHGIRVFNQAPFETLISFIISANNNIKRISNTIEKLCRLCGDKIITVDGDIYYAFPTLQQLCRLTVDELVGLGLGYRAGYIYDTVRMLADDPEFFNTVCKLPYNEAQKMLCSLRGVGEKVADCVLLFSLEHSDAFPMDVWMKRAMSILFFDDCMPKKAELQQVIRSFSPYAGIIQQYIFHYARSTKLGTQGGTDNDDIIQ